MYAAFQLIMAGLSVTIVDALPELYERKRLILVDPKLMAHLRFFLGTKFDNFYIGSKSLADETPTDLDLVIEQYLEEVLKVRLVELISYVEYAHGHDEKSKGTERPVLELLYETALEDIQLPASDGRPFIGLLGPSTTRLNSEMKGKLVKHKKLAEFFGEDPNASRDSSKLADQIGNSSSIEVDLLVCATTHPTCNKFLGELFAK